MRKESRTHTSDEFGKGTSGGIRGFDPPMIGAPTSILIDGLVERESGATPSPWSVSVTGIVVFLVGMFVLGLVLTGIAFTIRQRHHTAAPPAQHVTTYDPAHDRQWTR